jgi:hypothetical protein
LSQYLNSTLLYPAAFVLYYSCTNHPNKAVKLVDQKIPAELETQLRSEATSPDAFKATLDSTTPEEQLAVWKNIVVANDLKITPALQEKIKLLYESTEREWDYIAQNELATAASHASPELFALLFSLVKDEEAREEASKVVKKNAGESSPSQLLEDMVIAIRNAEVNKLQELVDHAVQNHAGFFNEGNAYGSGLILDALNAEDKKTLGELLPPAARAELVAVLTDAGAVPLTVRSAIDENPLHNHPSNLKEEDPFFILETQGFGELFVLRMQKILFNHQHDHGQEVIRNHYKKEKPVERRPLRQEEVVPQAEPELGRKLGLAVMELTAEQIQEQRDRKKEEPAPFTDRVRDPELDRRRRRRRSEDGNKNPPEPPSRL